MFENKQINDLFRTSLNGFFDTRLDDIFNYKKVAPITYKRREWKSVREKINVTDISDWEVSGNTGWEKVDGYFQNKDIGDNQTATISKTFKQVTHIEFDYKVSSESGYDFLHIYINGDEKVKVSGDIDWKRYLQDFNKPTDVEIKFTYSKDKYTSRGNDAGYFKNLEIVGDNFQSLNGLNNKTKISTNYQNNKNLIKFRITPYNSNINNSQFRITPYKNKQNLTFYRLGLETPPPIRIILKDLDDED